MSQFNPLAEVEHGGVVARLTRLATHWFCPLPTGPQMVGAVENYS